MKRKFWIVAFRSSAFRDIRIYSEGLIKEYLRQYGDHPDFAGVIPIEYEVPRG